jgi:hypothetical protein
VLRGQPWKGLQGTTVRSPVLGLSFGHLCARRHSARLARRACGNLPTGRGRTGHATARPALPMREPEPRGVPDRTRSRRPSTNFSSPPPSASRDGHSAGPQASGRLLAQSNSGTLSAVLPPSAWLGSLAAVDAVDEYCYRVAGPCGSFDVAAHSQEQVTSSARRAWLWRYDFLEPAR